MKNKKREKTNHGRTARIMFIAVCLVIISFFASISYQDQQYCENFQSYHPVRIIVKNQKDTAVWLQVDYSSISQTDTWLVDAKSEKIIYTKHTFQPDSNVTITFHIADPNTQSYISTIPPVVVHITRSLSVVKDDNYQNDLTQRDPTIDLKCVTDQVYDAPTIIIQPP